jgi:hypothetical protein
MLYLRAEWTKLLSIKGQKRLNTLPAERTSLSFGLQNVRAGPADAHVVARLGDGVDRVGKTNGAQLVVVIAGLENALRNSEHILNAVPEAVDDDACGHASLLLLITTGENVFWSIWKK